MTTEFEGTVYADLQRGQLVFDTRYQRTKIRWAHVRRIAEEFDPDGFGILHVAPTGDDHYVVIDGQHRVLAIDALAVRHPEWGPECWLPCLVHATANEALTFVTLSGSVPLTVLERLKARYAGGEPKAVAMVDLVRECGLEFAFDGVRGGENRYLSVTSRIEEMFEREPDRLRWTLLTALEAFPSEEAKSLNGTLLMGIFLFSNYAAIDGQKFDTARLIRALSGKSPSVIRKSAAKEYAESTASGVAMVLLELYNKTSGAKMKRWSRSEIKSLSSEQSHVTRKAAIGDEAYRQERGRFGSGQSNPTWQSVQEANARLAATHARA